MYWGINKKAGFGTEITIHGEQYSRLFKRRFPASEIIARVFTKVELWKCSNIVKIRRARATYYRELTKKFSGKSVERFGFCDRFCISDRILGLKTRNFRRAIGSQMAKNKTNMLFQRKILTQILLKWEKMLKTDHKWRTKNIKIKKWKVDLPVLNQSFLWRLDYFWELEIG